MKFCYNVLYVLIAINMPCFMLYAIPNASTAVKAQKAIIFDLDVLFTVKESPGGLISAMVDIDFYRNMLFNIITHIKDYDQYATVEILYNNQPLSSLWHAYFLNHITGKQIYKKICQEINNNKQLSWLQRKILQEGARQGFYPEKQAKITLLNKNTLEFIKWCKKHYKIIIFSNKHTESLQALLKKYPDFFSLFSQEDIIISGSLGILKPHIAAYNQLLKKLKDRYNIVAHDCIIVERYARYAQIAYSLGMQSIILPEVTLQEIQILKTKLVSILG